MRFLPNEVANLIIKYLVFIRPIERYFASSILENSKAKLYNSNLINTNNITSNLERVFSIIGVAPLTISEYRHVVIALIEKNLRLNNNIIDLDDLYDEQAGHSHSIAVNNYVTSQYDTRVTTRDSIQEFYKCSIKWQELLGIRGNILPKVKEIKLSKKDNNNDNSINSLLITTESLIIPLSPSSLLLESELSKNNNHNIIICLKHILKSLRKFLNNDNGEFKSLEQAKGASISDPSYWWRKKLTLYITSIY